jgi:membrane peptidoglycan carboxypeptidase
VALGVFSLTAFALGIVFYTWVQEGAALGRSHQQLKSLHAGWSFPAKLYSRAVELDSVSFKRQLLEAKARGYRENCRGKEDVAGTFCEKTKKVVPKTGRVLEPVLLAVLVGKDAELRTHLPLNQAPKALLDAIVSAEDHDFYSHRGVSFGGLLRALLANSKEGRYSQGASTLTMQVVRSLSTSREKTLKRKLKEVAFAFGLERALHKDGVMQMYLDAPYLGQRGSFSVCGFAEAARHYFSRDVRDLTLSQVATLVAVLPGPGKYAPDKNLEACRARRNLVLNEMHKRFGYDVSAALNEPLTLSMGSTPPERFPAYVSAVRSTLEERLGAATVYGAGLQVETALDVVMQTQGEALFESKSKSYEGLVGAKRGTLQSVGVALDVSNGALLALYGGHTENSSDFNRATQAHRQPGSSFKPVVYALAFSTKKYTAASTQPNSPRDFLTPAGKWRPYNVSGEATATASLAEALAWSQNIATASLLDSLGGPKPLIDFAAKCGFDTSHFKAELGLALGQAEVTPMEMARFVALIANGGRRVEGTPILRAVDQRGVERIGPPQLGEAVLDPVAAALTRELMRLVVDYGTGGAIRGVAGEAGYAGPAIGKTGTTDSEKDLWFIGATPKVAAAVWLGFDLPARIGAAASDLAAPLWGWWIQRSTGDSAPWPDFPKNPTLVKQGICSETGKLPNEHCKVVLAPFEPGTVPKSTCTEVHEPSDDDTVKPAHESLWKRKEREAQEKADRPDEL